MPYFEPQRAKEWIENEQKYWETTLSGRQVTKPFFDELAKLQWTCNFPTNPNGQRRLQDIKEMGYTIASRATGKGTQREYLLLPIPRGAKTGYETFSQEFHAKAVAILNNLNIYELSSANKGALMPDHKFPEIRWNEKTIGKNKEDMTEKDVKNKFQLLDNQRNQQKREICRTCFQTNKRGIAFGIKYFYEGDENWETNFQTQNLPTSKIGKEAEKGCVGCAWYDLEAWRKSLNEFIATQVKPS